MLSEDLFCFSEACVSIRFCFRIFEVYLYIGITSLCLYIITEKTKFQVAILAKIDKNDLCKRQKSVQGNGFPVKNR